MKNIPNRIYLQIDPENEKPETFNELNGVTWSVDKINDNDIPYYRHKNSNLIRQQVSRGIGGYCEDCKFWKMENFECTNDIIWLNKPDNIFLNISDLKTHLKFGCIRFESKNSA